MLTSKCQSASLNPGPISRSGIKVPMSTCEASLFSHERGEVANHRPGMRAVTTGLVNLEAIREDVEVEGGEDMETTAPVPFFWGVIPCFQKFEGSKLELSQICTVL